MTSMSLLIASSWSPFTVFIDTGADVSVQKSVLIGFEDAFLEKAMIAVTFNFCGEEELFNALWKIGVKFDHSFCFL